MGEFVVVGDGADAASIGNTVAGDSSDAGPHQSTEGAAGLAFTDAPLLRPLQGGLVGRRDFVGDGVEEVSHDMNRVQLLCQTKIGQLVVTPCSGVTRKRSC